MVDKQELNLRLDAPRAGTEWPVTFSVPLGEGDLKEDDSIVLTTEEGGREIQVQTTPLVFWPDGSVRWLLLDFISEMDRDDLPLTLTKGESVSGQGNFKVDEELNRIKVSDKGYQAVIHHGGDGLLGEVKAGESTVIRGGGTSEITESDGKVHRQAAPYRVRVERSGTRHAVITSEGYYDAEGEQVYRYEARTHFFARLPLIKIEYTVINECPEKEGRSLEGIDLNFELSAEGEARFGSHRGEAIKQVASGTYELDGEVREGRFPGSIEVGGQLTAVMKDFWQRYPSALGLKDNILTFGLLADPGEDGMPFAQGEAQSREIWIWFGADRPDSKDMVGLVQKRPILIWPPEWVSATGAFGQLSPHAPEDHAAYEEAVERGFENALKTREERDEYGYRDYGDSRYDAMPRGWLNNEYDWGHAYLMQFARTGDRKYWDFAEGRVRHMLDTDLIHYRTPPELRLIGAPHSHSTDHTSGGVDIGHSWLEGLFDLWALAGNERARKGGRGMADFYARCVGNVRGQRYKNRPGARRPGWGLIGLMYAYEYTLDEKYLEAAEEIVEVCAREQVDSGAWIYPAGSEGVDDPLYLVGKTFMIALTLRGLQRYHEFTGDELAEEIFLKGVDWTIDYMWNEKTGGFRYVDPPHDRFQTSPGSSAQHLLEPLVYAAQLTGDTRYRYVAARTWKKWIEEEKPALKPSIIRHIVHYLPHHRGVPEYEGDFPLKSIESSQEPYIRDIYFTDADNGLAVGLYGLMLSTEDGGVTWKKAGPDRKDHLFALDFSDEKNGLAAGVGSELLMTHDGGRSWEARKNLDVSGRSYHYDLKMIDADTGYIAGSRHIWKTEDGGRTWLECWDARHDNRWGKGAKVLSLHPLGKETIWAVGNTGLAMTVEDGGTTFREQKFSHPRTCLCVEFVDEKTGFIVGEGGVICRTQDGGENWEQKRLAEDDLWRLDFLNSTVGYAAGRNGVVLVTRDGGDSWKKLETGTEKDLRALAVLSPDEVFIGGDSGTLMRTDDGGESWEQMTIAGE